HGTCGESAKLPRSKRNGLSIAVMTSYRSSYSGPCPGGISENSQAIQFQRWVRSIKYFLSPEGTVERQFLSHSNACASAVPSGLERTLCCTPNVKTLGYSRKSLRDKERRQSLAVFTGHQILAALGTMPAGQK